MPHVSRRALVGLVLLALSVPFALWAEEQEIPKIRQLRCGSCPDGFATTAVTNDPATCKDGDPTLVQCVPLGGNLLSVCGECPEGYVKVGGTVVPSQCNRDGGMMSRCQLPQMEHVNPDPTQGGRRCPPDCTADPSIGQGGSGPVPQTLPPPVMAPSAR